MFHVQLDQTQKFQSRQPNNSRNHPGPSNSGEIKQKRILKLKNNFPSTKKWSTMYGNFNSETQKNETIKSISNQQSACPS